MLDTLKDETYCKKNVFWSIPYMHHLYSTIQQIMYTQLDTSSVCTWHAKMPLFAKFQLLQTYEMEIKQISAFYSIILQLCRKYAFDQICHYWSVFYIACSPYSLSKNQFQPCLLVMLFILKMLHSYCIIQCILYV